MSVVCLLVPHSMATPLVAATALLVKQYFEERAALATSTAHRWSSVCRSSYRSCPVVSTEVAYASAPLIKAVLVGICSLVDVCV